MFKTTFFAGCATAVALMASTPAQAADPEPRILRIPAGLCEDFKQDLIKWASRTAGHGAYSVPVVPRGSNYSCDNPGPSVPAAQSFGFSSQPPADSLAKKECDITRPDGFRPCVVIARSFPQSSR